MKRAGAFFLLTLFFLQEKVQARVFNFGSESLAAYVAGAWGPAIDNTSSSLSDTTSSTSVTLNTQHPYNLAGEVGILYGTPRANLRFAMEVVHPKDITEQEGKNSAGGVLYNMTSEVSVLVPKIAVEVALKNWGSSRLYIEGGVGYGTLIGRNSYTFTSTGNSTYSPVTDFYEDLRGNAVLYEGSLGFERLFSDTTTYAFFAGYRGLNFEELRHNRDVTTFQGSVSKGDRALNKDGSQRSLDLSSYFVGFAFRFWIH